MEYRFLGSSGLKLSTLSLGSWVTFGSQIDDGAAAACMKAAFDAGVNYFDTAEAYAGGRAEVVMGNIIRRYGWRRSDLVIATKVFWGGEGPNDRGLSRKHIMESIDASLRRLQMDYVDLFFCHRPDLHTPIEETVRAMNGVIAQGKAFYWGTSEWSAGEIMEAAGIARREHLIPPQMEQPQYNMFWRDRVEREYARLYDTLGLGTTIWSPLASGLLTGKYGTGVAGDGRLTLSELEWLRERVLEQAGANAFDKIEALKAIAADLDATMSQLALAWCLRNPNVSTVITGASRVEQVRENLRATAITRKLTDDVLARIESILHNEPEGPQDFR